MREIHAHHLRAIGVTIPRCGRYAYWSPPIEGGRDTTNAWIRTGHAFAAVVDCDRALRTPPIQLP